MTDASLPVGLIDDFLYEYEPANLGRAMTVAERALAEEVLFDFIVTDLAAEPSAECRAALANIRSLVGTSAPALLDDVERQLRLIEHGSRRMSVQLARRERSFDIMREHLVMIADQLPPDWSPPSKNRSG